MNRILGAVLISLLLHLSFGYGIKHLPNTGLLSQFKTIPTEIEVEIPENLTSKRPEDQAKRPVVLQSIIPQNLLKESNDLAKLLSEKRQRVQDQTVAQHSGMTVNRSNLNASPAANKPRLELFKPVKPINKLSVKDDKTLEPGMGIQKKNRLPQDKQSQIETISQQNRTLGRMVLPGLNGLSTINERLNKYKIGDITALNTDPYLFYSFYQRMITQIRFHWERMIEGAMEHAAQGRFALPGKDEWITQAAFELDATGKIIRTQVFNRSGFKFFDEAALRAIQSGGPYINPPREMVESDGKIRLQLGFTVNWIPPKIISSPSDTGSSDKGAPKF